MTKLPAKATNDECMGSNPVDEGDAASGSAVDLPLHLTEKILCCISPLESVRLATVCKSWAATVSERLARPTPHLFAYPGRGLPRERRRGAIFHVLTDEDSPVMSPFPARFPAAVGHIGEGMSTNFVGALSSEQIAFTEFDYRTTGVVLLVDPVGGASQCVHMGPRCFGSNIVLPAGGDAFFVSDGAVLWMRRRADGDEWAEMPLPAECQDRVVCAAAYSNGVLYALLNTGFTFVVDARAPPPLSVTRIAAPSIPESCDIYDCHVLESEGKLLLVAPVLIPKRTPTTSVFEAVSSLDGFAVYRLDVQALRWAKMETLAGDRALFVGRGLAFAVRASETAGCRSNCIYFVDYYDVFADITWGVYSMEEREVLSRHAIGPPGMYKEAAWFLPGVRVGQVRH